MKKAIIEYIEEIVYKDRSTGELLKNHHSRLWSALNSYAHGGALSMNRRVDGNQLIENYSVAAIEEAASLANIYLTESLDLMGELCDDDEVRAIAMKFRRELIEAVES